MNIFMPDSGQAFFFIIFKEFIVVICNFARVLKSGSNRWLISFSGIIIFPDKNICLRSPGSNRL